VRIRNSAISRRFVRKVGVPVENSRGDNHDHIENEEIKIAPIRPKKYLSPSSLGTYHLQLTRSIIPCSYSLQHAPIYSIIYYVTYIIRKRPGETLDTPFK